VNGLAVSLCASAQLTLVSHSCRMFLTTIAAALSKAAGCTGQYPKILRVLPGILMPNDCCPPCNVWCGCVDRQCVPSTPMFNAELLRTRDGRPVKARLADPAFEVVLCRPILLAQDSLSDAKLARVP
jgi:hypothetical protein